MMTDQNSSPIYLHLSEKFTFLDKEEGKSECFQQEKVILHKSKDVNLAAGFLGTG